MAVVVSLDNRAQEVLVDNRKGAVRGLAFNPDGFQMALLLDDARGPELRFLDVRTGRRLFSRPSGKKGHPPHLQPRRLSTPRGRIGRWACAADGEKWDRFLVRNPERGQPGIPLQGPYARAAARTPMPAATPP